MGNLKNERSLIPLVIISGLVAAPLIFIAGMIFGSQIQLLNILTADSLSSWIGAIATVSIAILTFVLAKETWYLRAAQIEQVNELRRENIRPNVSLALKSSPVAINFKIVELQNLGKGIARNVIFSYFDKDNNRISNGQNPVVDEFQNIHIFSSGMASLGIGQKIESFLLSIHDIKSKLPDDDIFSPNFKVRMDYEDVEGTKYENEVVIDFRELKGISTIGDSAPLQTMSGELKKLREQVETMTSSSFKRLHVNTFSSSDRKQERLAREKERNERIQKKTPKDQEQKDC